MQLTEDRLRRLAWLTFGCVCASILVALAAPLLAHLAPDRVGDPKGTNSDLLFGLLLIAFPVAGVLVANRQPRNAVGWLMLVVGLIAYAPTTTYADYGLLLAPGSLPGADVAAALTAANWAPVLGLVGTYLVLLFPDGHLPSRRWRPVGWFAGLAVVWVYLLITTGTVELDEAGYPGVTNPLGIPWVGDAMPVLLPTIVVLPISFVLCAAGLITRFRRSSGVERLQLKWLATSGGTVAFLYFATVIASLSRGIDSTSAEDPLWLGIAQNIAVFSFVLIPVSIGVAILKHRLYEIDVVINKAVVYGTLAVFITTAYVAIVVGLGSLVGRGDEPNLALSVAATAVVAVAFQPVQHRAQRVANRLVYGERATPYEVLAEFTDRVAGSYEAGELLPTMARTVAHGVGAVRAGVWLARGHGLVREATWPEGPDQGGPAAVVAGDPGELEADRVVPVRHQGELLGAVSVTKPAGEQLTPVETKLLDDVAAQAGLVLRNVRLIEDLRSSRERLVTTQDHERRRLERNLHDGAQQRLVAVALMIRTSRAQLGADDADVGAALDQAADQLRNAISELRELARGIHPAILTERGLGPALTSLAERSPVPVVVDYDLSERLPQAIEASLYFAAAEALTNVVKYAHATQVEVVVTRGEQSVTLEVVDDGIGGADGSRGSGLRGLADRVAVVDGTFSVHSPASAGTRVTCTVPLQQPRVPEPEQLSTVGGG